ncbi:Rpn family recombination-promoting nuclease/putative transposase [Enterococcus pallens]|uniref:Transposase (putative) YhgA-like domain-containing protein n=1 Tax=Enterococcus pallens ATCC BAA-351 TaxID=1158607 RepID=R2QCW0_9ENTE|nr:Rpn family recombination-promoting nuclease/putative transposase [Enterococcus pallens]EOH93073.1 hypothetical protein UAU_02715 [Enterococcus pallens ATCC BAA-351]EOU24859.1 hypothetical protein I588_00846 [Enterococcus pallens ATCC BAA-351]OJG76127.1 hypothetical protein RV10_GL004188 [Enterococcus pallens]
MQLQPHDFFTERSFLYLVEAYRDPLGDQKVKDFIKKNNYSALRPAYGINVVDFHLFDKTQPAIRRFALKDMDTAEPLLAAHKDELIILCFFNLKNPNIDCTSAAYHWQQFFKTGEASEAAPEYIKEAKAKIDYYSLNKEELAMIMEINKARMIQDAVIATAERVAKEKGVEQGREQGIELGREQGQKIGEHKKAKEIAQSLLIEGMPIDSVAKTTNLTIEEVKELTLDTKDS